MLEAPRAARRPTVRVLHGERLVDDYAWLRRRDDPRVLAHLRAENAFADAHLKRLEPLRRQLVREIRARLQETDQSLPSRRGAFWYSTRSVRGKQHPIYLRSRRATGPWAVVLDLNVLAKGRRVSQLGQLVPSPDGRFLAFTLDQRGALDFTLFVKDLERDRLLPLRASRVDSVAWADGETLVFATNDDTQRAATAWRHRLGARTPERLFDERDGRFSLEVSKTVDDAFVVLSSRSKDTTALRVLDARTPAAALRLVLAKKHGREASLAHHQGRFLLRLNDTGPNFRVVSVPASRPSAPPLELVPHRPDALLEHLDVLRDALVLRVRRNGVVEHLVRRFDDGSEHRVDSGEALSYSQGRNNDTFDTTVFRFATTSLTTPERVYDYDVVRRKKTLRKRTVVHGYRPSQYESRRLFARAPDGRRVPLTLVWKKALRRDGPQPLLLEGYGAYGISNELRFSPSRVSLLDRGVIVAFAHVRGGSELGRTWYLDGKLAKKPNSFTDYLACAETLVAQRFTTAQQLIAVGGSAGGLLVAAAANLRPDLFHSVVAEVPFVDVLNTMLDDTLPLTVEEYLEWGDPRRRADFEVLRSYSPYENLRAQPMPHVYLRTSFHDRLVPYWEAAKFAARLRATKTNDSLVLLSVDFGAGHAGASGRYDRLSEHCRVLAFLLDQWGLGARHSRHV